MGQKDSVASQDNHFATQQNLANHLGQVRHLNTRNILDALHKRQEKTLAPLRHGLLEQPSFNDWLEYFNDLSQRSVLFWDTLRQRGDNTLAHQHAGYPLLLKFDHETLVNGADLPHPVNYSLLRILPGPEQKVDSTSRPTIIIDPRGGHGSGIGGFKEDSEIGESLRAGHPTYFIAFSHSPEPGQTLDYITEAEAHFIEVVRALHPASPKPVVIGNCQAGWALMSLAAVRPELPGLLIINGAPLSYWAGVNGRNPMRYAGGLLGGAWVTRLGSDLGNDRFDGAWLVSNFENLDPANSYWGKYYHLFRDVDDEAARFLDFERWWGSPTLLNGDEIEMIVDDLFIGNQLSGGPGRKSTGLDLKRIEVPVVVFCSYGDNITPPQQALDWISDVYPSDLALRAAGRTIVYLRHASVGHLGIFVSGKVARREHRELLGAVEAINALPAGLYELLIDDVPDPADSDSLEYSVRFEPRRIADIHGDSKPTRDSEQEFTLVDRASEVNSALYSWFVRPFMRQVINEPTAEVLRKAHPFHQQQVVWSSLNPALWWLAGTADLVRNDRRTIRQDNPLLAWQDLFSNLVHDTLNAFRDVRDAAQELCFYSVYSAMDALTSRPTTRNLEEPTSLQDKALLARLREALPHGGRLDALVRILFLLGRNSDKIGKRRIEQWIQHGHALALKHAINTTSLRETLQLQSLLVFAHPEESLRSLPLLLPQIEDRQEVLATVAQWVPELLSAEGATGGLWRELHTLLEVPLPVPGLNEPPAHSTAETDMPTAEPVEPVQLAEPVEQVEPVQLAEPLEPLKLAEPVEPVEPVKPVEEPAPQASQPIIETASVNEEQPTAPATSPMPAPKASANPSTSNTKKTSRVRKPKTPSKPKQ
ncbi:DUF3141 domain-containing protein [Pseudomonas sp. R5(2019)]|uniref:DUF3141 domain-containing protein n=1 Tax=Pseudomonas sp. R5(2019) TaxID=2697566 RepID=UPI00141291E6|nr:DUF3141 domain-containing protein [Pseudomonas sp. R5(2019)]NBA96610.1 DUF3141 domain-containing protein [Pseudomonas sp. R5(2019)]